MFTLSIFSARLSSLKSDADEASPVRVLGLNGVVLDGLFENPVEAFKRCTIVVFVEVGAVPDL